MVFNILHLCVCVSSHSSQNIIPVLVESTELPPVFDPVVRWVPECWFSHSENSLLNKTWTLSSYYEFMNWMNSEMKVKIYYLLSNIMNISIPRIRYKTCCSGHWENSFAIPRIHTMNSSLFHKVFYAQKANIQNVLQKLHIAIFLPFWNNSKNLYWHI